MVRFSWSGSIKSGWGMCLERRINALNFLVKRGCSMMENFVVFDTSPSNDLNVLFDVDINELYYYRRVVNTLASVVNL